MRRLKLELMILIVTTFFVWSHSLFASTEIPNPIVPTRYFNDYTSESDHVYSEDEIEELENLLIQYADTFATDSLNFAEIYVVTVDNLNGLLPESYAQQLVDKWSTKLGNMDASIVILIKPKKRYNFLHESKGEIYIKTGSLVADKLTDFKILKIIDREIIPSFKEGDYADGVRHAIVAIKEVLIEGVKKETILDKVENIYLRLSMRSRIILLSAIIILGLMLPFRRKKNKHKAKEVKTNKAEVRNIIIENGSETVASKTNNIQRKQKKSKKQLKFPFVGSSYIVLSKTPNSKSVQSKIQEIVEPENMDQEFEDESNETYLETNDTIQTYTSSSPLFTTNNVIQSTSIVDEYRERRDREERERRDREERERREREERERRDREQQERERRAAEQRSRSNNNNSSSQGSSSGSGRSFGSSGGGSGRSFGGGGGAGRSW